jgi:hypothetical protein
MGGSKKLPNQANKLTTYFQSSVSVAQPLDWVDNLHRGSPLSEAGGLSTLNSGTPKRENGSSLDDDHEHTIKKRKRVDEDQVKLVRGVQPTVIHL